MNHTPEQIAEECERLFQAGGPKVYTFDPEQARFIPTHIGVKRALALACTTYQVWARRKVRGKQRYEWCLMGFGK